LAIGAHPDDIELGAGGFLSRLVRDEQSEIHIAILTYGLHHWQRERMFEEDDRAREALRAAALLLQKSPSVVDPYLHFGGFPDTQLSAAGHGPIKFLEDVIRDSDPTLILTHAAGDVHDDHRKTHDASLSAAREFGGTLLFYQAPSTKPNEFRPNFFVVLDRHALEAKQEALGAHASQRDKQFLSHKRVTGMAYAWALFHRLKYESLEAFELYQHYWRTAEDG
jgi:LmbE family N-acetylglucosaminyl deacetylase